MGGKHRFVLVSLGLILGSIPAVACSGATAFVENDPFDAGAGGDARTVPTATATSTATGTGTAIGTTTPSPPPVDAGGDAETSEPDASTDAGHHDAGAEADAGTDAGIDAGTGDDDDDDTTTCLDPTPIDQTQFPYVKAAAVAAGSCSNDDLKAFSAFYKEHQADDELVERWPKSVPSACAHCIFTDERSGSPKVWRSLVIEDDTTFLGNQGGCIEIVSGSFACGRAYQQFQACTVEACTTRCTTQAEFNQCRQDATVLTTACKSAYDALKKECGADLAKYQNACRGTTYTFEGPIRVSCIGTGVVVTPKDAGPRDAADAN